MKIRRRLLSLLPVSATAFFIALSLSSCVTTAPVINQSSNGVALDKDMVFIRISVEGLKYLNSFSLLARPVKGGEPIKIQGWSMSSTGYWSTYYDEVEKGELVATSLPAGEYEIYSFVATASAWGGPRTVSPEKSFSFPFRVESGESIYLGNLSFRFKGDSGVLPSSMGTVKVDDQRKIGFDRMTGDTRLRDFKEIETRFPSLQLDRLKVRLLK